MEAAMDVIKMLKQNAVKSKNAQLKCCKFSTLQKREDAAKNKCFTVDWGYD